MLYFPCTPVVQSQKKPDYSPFSFKLKIAFWNRIGLPSKIGSVLAAVLIDRSAWGPPRRNSRQEPASRASGSRYGKRGCGFSPNGPKHWKKVPDAGLPSLSPCPSVSPLPRQPSPGPQGQPAGRTCYASLSVYLLPCLTRRRPDAISCHCVNGSHHHAPAP